MKVPQQDSGRFECDSRPGDDGLRLNFLGDASFVFGRRWNVLAGRRSTDAQAKKKGSQNPAFVWVGGDALMVRALLGGSNEGGQSRAIEF